MKKLLAAALLALAGLAGTAPAARAGTFGLFYCRGCWGCNKCGCCLCIRPYNAFTPVCCGTVTGLGCVGGGYGGGYGPYGSPGSPDGCCGSLDLNYQGTVCYDPAAPAPGGPAMVSAPAPVIPQPPTPPVGGAYPGVQAAGYAPAGYYPVYAPQPAPVQGVIPTGAAPSYWYQ